MAMIFRTIDGPRTREALARAVTAQSPEIRALLARGTAAALKRACKLAGVEPILHKRWRFRYTDHLGRRVKATGTMKFSETKRKATRLEARADEIRQGIRPAPRPSDEVRDWAESVAEYLAWGKAAGGWKGHGWAQQHLVQKRNTLEFWRRELAAQSIQDVRLPDVEKVLRKLQAQELAGKTLQGYAEAIRSFCAWLCEPGRRWLAEDPLAALAAFNTKPKLPHRAFEPDELQRLFSPPQPAPPLPRERALLYRVALETGYRQKECRALKVGDLDAFGPSLPLAAEFTKNRTDARQPITPELLAELQWAAKGRPATDRLLWCPIKKWLGKTFDKDLKAARISRELTGVKGRLTFHSFRVSYVNAVIESGADLKTIMELARHGAASMSMETYAKPRSERLRTAAEAVAASLQAIKAGPTAVQQVAVGAEGEMQPPTPQELVDAQIGTPIRFESWWAHQNNDLQQPHVPRSNSAHNTHKPCNPGGLGEASGNAARNLTASATHEPRTNSGPTEVQRGKIIAGVKFGNAPTAGMPGAGPDVPPEPQPIANHAPPPDPQLSELEGLWAHLPDYARETILQIARQAKGGGA